jgi:hypothetical protein
MNVSVNSGTVHALTLVHCVVSKPFSLSRPVLFDSHKSVHFTKGNSASLFESIVMRLTWRGSSILTQDSRQLTYVIGSFVIDSLRAQANGFDLFLFNILNHSASIQVRRVAYTPNLVPCPPRDGGPFSAVGGESMVRNCYCANAIRFHSLTKMFCFNCHSLTLFCQCSRVSFGSPGPGEVVFADSAQTTSIN